MLYKYDNRNVTITNWSNKTRHLGQLHGCTSKGVGGAAAPRLRQTHYFSGRRQQPKMKKMYLLNEKNGIHSA